MVTCKFSIGDRVKLRAVDSELYRGLAVVGNEGWIKKIREDRFGLPLVWVEWDKNHWAYNEAPDCWTFEDHFDLIEKSSQMSEEANTPDPEVPDRGLSGPEIMAYLNKLIQSQAQEEAAPPELPQDEQDQPYKPSEDEEPRDPLAMQVLPREDAIAEATEMLGDAESFVVISVKKVDNPLAPEGMMIPDSMTWSASATADILAGAYVASVATELHQEIVMRYLKEFINEPGR